MKRKLATVSIAFSAGVLLAVSLLPAELWLYVAAALLAVALLFAAGGKIKLSYPIALCCFFAACAFIWCSIYSRAILMSLEKYDNAETEITALVTTAPKTTDYGSSADIRIMNWDVPAVKAKLYIFDDAVSELEAGEKIRIKAKITYTPEATFEGAPSLAAKGNFISCSCSEEPENLGKSEMWGLFFPARFAHRVKELICSVFPDDVSPFITALLTGDTQRLSEDSVLSNALSSSGIYHVCAVSGLHVMFIASIISFICPVKWISSTITIILTAIFAAMTGFSSSVLRAAFMLSASLIAPLFDREADSITSLFAVLMLLLIMNPWSIMSVGLELSFAATLGIILLSSKIAEGIKSVFAGAKLAQARIGKYFISSFSAVLATTVGAMVFTIPISALWFGYISLAAPLTNLAFIWLISLIFYAAVICCILGFLLMPAAAFIGKIVAYPIRLICASAKLISKCPLTVLYTSGILTIIWLLLIYAAIILLIYFRRDLRYALIASGVLAVMLVAVTVIKTQTNNDPGLVAAILDVGQGQCIILRDSGYTAVIDCGSISTYKSGQIASKWLRTHGENCIDLMIFTHFDSDHANGADDLFAKEKIGAIAMPVREDAAGENWSRIEYLSGEYDAPITYIDSPCTVKLGTTSIMLYQPLEPGGENSGLVVLASCDGYDMLITGDIPQSAELRFISTYSVPDIELLIVGHHGSYHSTADAFLDSVIPEKAVISAGENTFGHPHAATIEKLTRRNIQIFRTDVDGTVIFYSNGESYE